MSGTQQSPTNVCTSILKFARHVDSMCSIAGVVKVNEDLLVKIRPSDCESGSCLRLLYALRVRFPFSSVVAVEDHAQQRVFVQILLHTRSEELKLAKENARQYRCIQILSSSAWILLVSGLVSFACMLHAAVRT